MGDLGESNLPLCSFSTGGKTKKVDSNYLTFDLATIQRIVSSLLCLITSTVFCFAKTKFQAESD